MNSHETMPAFYFVFLGMLLLICCLGIWTFQDAKKRGMNPLLWGLAVVFAHFVGLIAYLMARQHYPELEQCANCGGKVTPGTFFCPDCGASLLDNDTCSSCGKKLNGKAFCSSCGARNPQK